MNRPLVFVLLVSVFSACNGLGQSKSAALKTVTPEQLAATFPQVESLYLDLHSNPELAMHEKQTAFKLAERLKATGFDVTTGIGGTGIVAILRNGSGPTVLLRTDMDALPSASVLNPRQVGIAGIWFKSVDFDERNCR